MCCWNDIIGQNKAKSKLDFHFNAAMTGEALPAFMICGPRGFGKTCIGEAFAQRLKAATGGKKRAYTTNCASIKNLKGFWNSIVVPVINDRDATILFDEAHKLPNDVTNALLTMINPNENERNSYTYDDMTVDIDLKRQSFMFATTEVHLCFYALLNRCRRIDLEEYTYNDLGKILQCYAKNIEFKDNVLDCITPTLRGAARQAVMMAKDIKTYLAPLNKSCFDVKDWWCLSRVIDVLPLGLTRGELRTLEILSERRDCSLTRLASSLRMTPISVQKDLELYLQAQCLMEITPNGRNLTPKGYQYLKDLTV